MTSLEETLTSELYSIDIELHASATYFFSVMHSLLWGWGGGLYYCLAPYTLAFKSHFPGPNFLNPRVATVATIY